MDRSLVAVDLFAGCGGLTLGLKNAGFSVLAAVEIDRKASQTYRKNHPDCLLIESDIREVSAESILSATGQEVGDIDLLAGCPPCQGFSSIRSKNRSSPASDPRNELIDEFSRLAFGLRPKIIMMENVPALERYPKFMKFLDSLRADGYNVKCSVVNVGDYGVPQRRRRMVLVASRIGEAPFAHATAERRTVSQTIRHLKRPGLSGDLLHDNTAGPRSPKVQEIICAIPKDGGSRSSLPESLKLDCHKKTSGFNDVYGRMAWDELAPTITGGCHNPSKGRFLHPDQDRVISLREAALLQSFPEDYEFILDHGKEAVALMIGNALPPKFIELQAVEMRKELSRVVE